MNREEVDAKIAASEARTDSQFASVIARLDALANEMREIKAEMASVKKTIVLTGISSTLAIIFGVAGFNAALLNNMGAMFESGKEMGQWQSEIRKQTIENELAQAKIRKQLEANDALQKQISAGFEKLKQERESERK